MPAKNKLRGNKLEYETVAAFDVFGIPSKRAWGSNGQALGLHEEVDVAVYGREFDKFVQMKIQCKRRKTLPSYLCAQELEKENGNFDALVLRRDNGKPLICMSLEKFIARYYD